MGDANGLIAEPLDLHFAPALTNAHGLDGQQLPLAGRLEDIRGGRQFGPIELLDDFLARRYQVRTGHEHRLMNN